MTELDRAFFEAFKQVDAICRDLFSSMASANTSGKWSSVLYTYSRISHLGRTTIMP